MVTRRVSEDEAANDSALADVGFPFKFQPEKLTTPIFRLIIFPRLRGLRHRKSQLLRNVGHSCDEVIAR